MIILFVLVGLTPLVQCDTTEPNLWQVMGLPELEDVVEILQTSKSFHFDDAKSYCDEHGGQLPVPDSAAKNEEIHKLAQFINVYKKSGTSNVGRMTYNTAPKSSKLSHRQNVIWLGVKRSDNLNWRNIYTNKRIRWGNWATGVKERASLSSSDFVL